MGFNHITNSSLKISVLILSGLLFVYSCQKTNKKNVPPTDRSQVIGYDSIQVSKSFVTLLDTCPEPIISELKEIKNAQIGQPVSAQSVAGRSFFTNYSTDDGLALDAIGCSLIDKEGNLWFGTNGAGVSRYNGSFFTNFTTLHGLVNTSIRCLLQDKELNIWMGSSRGGVDCYDGKGIVNYSKKNGLGGDIVVSCAEDNSGNLWFGTSGEGISCLINNGKAQKEIRNYTKQKNNLPSNSFWSIYKDHKGNLWFGGTKSIMFNSAESVASGLPAFKNFVTPELSIAGSVVSIIEDKKGNIWFGTTMGEIVTYDGNRFKNIENIFDFKNDRVNCIAEDRWGNLWVGTGSNGVFSFDGNNVKNYTKEQGLPNNEVATIVSDNAGNLWFGTNGGGISCYEGRAFMNFTVTHGLSHNIIWSIAEDKDGRIWFGEDGTGLSAFNGKSFSNYVKLNNPDDNIISCIYKDKEGALWFGTSRGGVHKYDGNKFIEYTTKQGLVSNDILIITQDKKGNMWFGGANGSGISCFDGKKMTNYTIENGLANDAICSIFCDDSAVWIGMDGCVVGYLVDKPGSAGKPYFKNYKLAANISNNSVAEIVKDSMGNVWFGIFGNGIFRYDGKTFLNFTTTEGLPDNGIAQIAFDSKDKMFIGSNQGIAVIKGFISNDSGKNFIPVQNNLSNQELSSQSLLIDVYNSQTGYPVKDINVGQNTVFKDSREAYWLATGADKTGVVKFEPSSINKNLVPPVVHLQKIKINNENICWNDVLNSGSKSQPTEYDEGKSLIEEVMLFGKPLSSSEREQMLSNFNKIKFESISRWYPIPQKLELPYDCNNVTFDFFAIETSRNAHVRYQYYLEGYDNYWNPVTDKTSATYGNIQEGEYTFIIKAKNVFGVWSEPIRYSFKVLPPWYRTWWAYGIYAALFVSLLYLLYRWRTATLRRDKELLELTVKERTTELERKTVEIEEQKRVIEKKNEKITDSINYAKHIQDSLLQSEEEIAKHLPESFIYYRPKDIVSGDFYWFSKKEDKIIVAIADCTGHGVPGAFMSMIGCILLNEIVNDLNYTDAGKILDELHERVYASLQKEIIVDSIPDGMDIGVCVIDKKNNILEFAGAQHSLYILRDNELKIIKADVRSIGWMKYVNKTNKDKGFETHFIPLTKGMNLYMCSDGYTDQFGGLEKRKFGSANLKELFVKISASTFSEQKQLINQYFESWKGNMQQTDDVLVMGFRINELPQS